MDAPDLYGEINEEPVPDGLSDAPQCEELFKSWKHQQQEKDRLLETIERLAEENKRILRERDKLEEECGTLMKRNNVYKKNAKMIFSVCRVELSKRERRIETLERRIASHGIVDGNSYSAAANSNEDDFTTPISLNLDTELKFTGILSELNHGLSRNKATREEMNNPNHPERDHPFDCRPFRGPKTPPTPSCKPSATRAKASSAERYDRKRDSRNSGSYNTSQSKYRRYEDYADEADEAYQKSNYRRDHVEEAHYRDTRDRRHIRRDDNYPHEPSHSEHSYGRYRDSGSKEGNMNRPDSRLHSRSDRVTDRERERDRGYECDRFQGRGGYDKNQYRCEYKRGMDDYCRSYDGGSEQQMLREERDRDSNYANGMRRHGSRNSHEGYDEYVDRRDSNRDQLNHRDRYSDRRSYDEMERRSYPGSHRSHNSRRYQEDDVGESGRGILRSSVEESHPDERTRRHDSRDSRSRDRLRDPSESRPEHSYVPKRPDKRVLQVHEKEMEKSAPSHVGERERRSHNKRAELENGDRNPDSQQERGSPGSHRRSKGSVTDERCDEVDVQTNTPIIPSSNSSETSHELRVREKRHLQASGSEDSKSKMFTASSPKALISPTPIVKPSETLDGLVKTLANLSHSSSSGESKESFTEADNRDASEPAGQVTTSPLNKTKSSSSGTGMETTSRSKMRKVRESKPILFTKVKEPQKSEELDSIQSSLDVAFFRDVESFSGKEIYHRNGRKEGLSTDDFAVAEGVRIQRKESEEAEEDNFVLGCGYNKGVDSDKPTETTFTKRMRERWEREEEAIANLQNLRNMRSDEKSPPRGNSAENVKENPIAPEADAGEAADKASDAQPAHDAEMEPVDPLGVQRRHDPDKLEAHPVNGLRRRSVSRSLEEAPRESRDSVDDEALPEVVESSLQSEAVVTRRSPPAKSEDLGGDGSTESPLRALPSPSHEVEIEDDGHFDDHDRDDEEMEEEEEECVTEDRRSESEYSDYDSGGEMDSPVKETIEGLEYDYDDDLEIEEVDTANVPGDDDRSEGEYSADLALDNGDELEEGEMEEGEILDDSENESVSGSGTGKIVDAKQKKKKRAKKPKIKKVGKGHGKGKKAKMAVASESRGSGRPHKPPRRPPARQAKPTLGGKSQAISGSSGNRSQAGHAREQAAFRGARHHESAAEGGVRPSRLAAARVERRLPPPPSQVTSRRPRAVELDSAKPPLRHVEDVRPVIRSRRAKVGGGAKDSSSAAGYRGRSPPARQGNCMPGKDFRSRRHALADRHRARR